MSHTAKRSKSSVSDDSLCPRCNRPLNISSTDAELSSSTAASKKQEGTLGKRKLSQRKKLRSADSDPTGKIESPWKPGHPVYVKAFINKDDTQWIPGVVDIVYKVGDGDFKIRVKVKDKNGDWVIPRVIHNNNQDPIPNTYPGKPDWNIKNYIVSRNANLEGLSDVEGKQLKCLNYHCRKKFDEENLPESDVFGRLLFEDDPATLTSFRNLVYSLMVDKNVNEVVKKATGKDRCSAQHAIAYFVGQLCGIELSETSTFGKEIDPHGLLDKLGSNNNVECPTSQVFLMSAMCARTKKADEFDPTMSLYDSRGREVLSDPEKLRVRMSKLRTALAAIHASQSDRISPTGPAVELILNGIRLMIDMRGTSDKLLDSLSEKGFTRHCSVLRYWIQKLAEAIDLIDPRSIPSSNESHVICWTFDNADFHLFQRVVSVVPVGNILLGSESIDDTNYFNQNYMKGLPRVSDIKAEDLAATKEEDDFAQDVIDVQNILALLTAATGYKWLCAQSLTRRSGTLPRPAVGSMITFEYRSEEREGTVKSSTAGHVLVEFSDGGRTVTRSIAMQSVSRNQDVPVMAEAAPTGNASQCNNEYDKFSGERHKFQPSTTIISSILTGLSSKNHETARQCMQEIINKYGEDKFYEAVHIIVADQEFMPIIMNDFFTRLKTEEELPIIPALALGHVMKGLSVSMMTYYQCFFDPMLEAVGVKIGSPEYNRYYKGKVIRKTNNLVTNFTEMLAVAAAHKYLSEAGNDNERIEVEDGTSVSPNSIISTHFATEEYIDHSTAQSRIAMDPNMRPVSITVTDHLKLLAQDFKLWCGNEYGTTGRAEIGPSGFEREPSEDPQLADPLQQQRSDIIEQDPKYEKYRNMPYGDEGPDKLGLLSLCTNAGIIDTSARRDKPTLSKKLYLYEEEKNMKAAVEFGPRRKMPKGVNSTGLTIHDLIFGVERFAIVQGNLILKIRPKDGSHRQHYPRDWLVFFKALTTSTFMRRQPNYQRLSLSFLIQLTLILNHHDQRCTDMALHRIRLTCAVSETGDSHKCTPVDLLQENSLVEQTKNVGRRDPTAFRNLEARSQLHSYIRIHEVEANFNVDAEFSPISPAKTAKAQEERRISRSIANVWLGILDEIKPIEDDADESEYESIQGLGDEQTKVLFTDRSRAYFRCSDAKDQSIVAGSAFLRGYEERCDVAMPVRKYPQLSCLHRSASKKKSEVDSVLKASSRQMQLAAQQSLTEDGHVTVSSSSSLLDGITKAGEGKAGIYPTVLTLMSDNKPYTQSVGQIGDGPSKPVILARTKADATNQLIVRSTRQNGHKKPAHIHVDAAKDLRCNITRRNGPKNTVINLARDMICELVQKYYFHGLEMLCLTMDVAKYMTILRVIPHAKRGKMDNIKIPHGSLSKVKKGTDDLTPYGARSDLLTCGDQHFIELLFDTICNQAKELEKGRWQLHKSVQQFALVVVGGSAQACVAVGVGGKKFIRLNSNSITVSCSAVEDEFERRQIVKIEEGEMMIYATMTALIHMGFTHPSSNEGLDCICVLHSDDSDAFAGIGMPFIYNLESTCLLQNVKFLGAIYIHGPKKSVPQLAKIGNIFKTNYPIDQQLCPTGKGFEFMVDLVSVYYRLEQDTRLPELPPGHRAISTVAVTYTLTNHDYLKTAPHGLTYSKLIATFRSSSYKNELKEYVMEKISPVNFTRQSVLTGQNHGSAKGYNLPGILILLNHAFINRSATKKALMEKNKPGLAYNTVRAASILGGELHAVPDPIALLAHISCGNLILRRWGVHAYNSAHCTDDELEATRYLKTEVKGRTVISVQYDLCDVAKKYKTSWTDEALLRKLKISCYGQLIPNLNVDEDIRLPFNPLHEIKKALQNQGFSPSVKVPSELLPATKEIAQTQESSGGVDEDESELLNELLEELNIDFVDLDSGGSDEERSIAGSLSGNESDAETEDRDNDDQYDISH